MSWTAAAVIASLLGTAAMGTNSALNADTKGLSSAELSAIRKSLNSGENIEGVVNYGDINAKLNQNEFWRTRTKAEQDAIIREYFRSGYLDRNKSVAWDILLRDLGEYSQVPEMPDASEYIRDYNTIYGAAKADIEAENQMLLDSLNAELSNIGDAYSNQRNQMLANQYMLQQQTVDTMASEMSRARRNAIEAGASAGVRIAGNVNAMLSTQNKLSQQSLETSNQLAQMLVNQRNAESGLRKQWRDTQMSTYDRIQDRTSSERAADQARYDDAYSSYESTLNRSVTPGNKLAERMSKYKTNSAFSNTGSGNYGG